MALRLLLGQSRHRPDDAGVALAALDQLRGMAGGRGLVLARVVD